MLESSAIRRFIFTVLLVGCGGGPLLECVEGYERSDNGYDCLNIPVTQTQTTSTSDTADTAHTSDTGTPDTGASTGTAAATASTKGR